MRLQGNPPEAVVGLKSTVDADGTITALACALGIDVTKYDGYLVALVMVSGGAGAVSLTAKPRGGNVSVPDGTWVDGGGDSKTLTGTATADTIVLVAEFDKNDFPDKKYAAIQLDGTIPAGDAIEVVLVGNGKRYA